MIRQNQFRPEQRQNTGKNIVRNQVRQVANTDQNIQRDNQVQEEANTGRIVQNKAQQQSGRNSDNTVEKSGSEEAKYR